jgi:hypothetical protein
MKRNRPALALPFLLLVTVGLSAQTDLLEAALRRADQDEKMVLALVTADVWCDPCNWFEENTLTAPQVQTELRNHWVFVRIPDTDPTATRWKVERLPAVFILDARGDTVRQVYGAVTADTLVQEMTSAREIAVADADASGAAGSTSTRNSSGDPSDTSPRSDIDRDGITYRLAPGTGTISKRQDGRWVTTDAGLPPLLTEYDRDEAFLYLQDQSSGTILALTVAPNASTSLWRWDTGERSWIEIGELEEIR